MIVPRIGKTVDIEVTDEDIKKGIRSNCSNCPITLAVLRTFPNMKQARTFLGEVYANPNKKKAHTYYRFVPVESSFSAFNTFIRMFDMHGITNPTTFTLERTA